MLLKLIKTVLPLFVIILFGTIGYMLIEEWPLLDSLYMTIISLTTVGYGETHPLSIAGKVFTMILILSGIGSFAFIVGNISLYFVQPFFKIVLKEKTMEKQLKKIKNHFIICGYGRIGRDVSKNLIAAGMPVVIIDKKPINQQELEELKVPTVVGDASHEEVLVKARIDKAKGLVSAVTSEAENVFITLTARELQSDLFIISRFEEQATRKKLLRAGASKVINPYQIGSDKISHIILKPTISKILDFCQKRGKFDLNIEELDIRPGNSLIGQTLKHCGIRDKHNIIIIAIEKRDGKIITTPSPDYIFEVNDRIVLIANESEIQSLLDEYT